MNTLEAYARCQQAISEGKIHAGSNEDYEGKDYQLAVTTLEALGFTNIQLVDLNDSGIAFWNNNKVVSVSINGVTNFGNGSWFDTDVPIIISYH